MHPSHIVNGGTITAIAFETDGYPFEVWDLEGLCEVAGCTCAGSSLTCGHSEAIFYNGVIAKAYAGLCLDSCRCMALIDRRLTSNGTGVAGVTMGTAINLPGYLNNTANTSNVV